MIEFNEQELQLIRRLSVRGGWDDDDADALKTKIRDYFLNRPVPCCCYCGVAMFGWHRITIDTEHVLPKGKFPQYTFEMRNLDLSCKRCNMQIKREDDSFYRGGANCADPFQSEFYDIVHPGLDRKIDHLKLIVVQADDKLMIKYFVVNASAKGDATYRYFRLQELEVNTFDEAQGLESTESIEDLPHEIVVEMNSITSNEGEI